MKANSCMESSSEKSTTLYITLPGLVEKGPPLQIFFTNLLHQRYFYLEM